MKTGLQGAHVLVTRPSHQAENLCRLIEAEGGAPVRFPTLQIIGLDVQSSDVTSQKTPATFSLKKLSEYQWLIFTSANAVNFAVQANGGKIGQFGSAQIAAIGKATEKALKTAGLIVALVPTEGFDSEALLAMPQMQAVKGSKVLIVKGQGGREELAHVLRDRGSYVDFWDVYKRIIPEANCAELTGLLDQDKLDVIIITSSESLQNLVVMLGEKYNKKLARTPLIVISHRIKQFAAEIGFARIKVAGSPSDEAILDAAIAVYNGE